MRWIYDEECVFYREPQQCAAHKCSCFLCEFRQKKIVGLDIKDHLGLVMGRNMLRLTFSFSALAAIISIIALVLHVFGN